MPRNMQTIERLYVEAQKYETIKEFKMKSHSAYVTAIKLGIGKEICFHMYKGKRKEKLITSMKEFVKDNSLDKNS